MSEETVRTEHDRQEVKLVDRFKALADAYTFVHGQEQVRALAATTFGQLLQTRIDEIRGPHPTGLPSRLEELDRIKSEFDRVIQELREDEDSAA